MTLLHPERLWLLALALPLVLFHLRMRRRVRVVVPSLLALDPRDFATAPPRVLGLLPRDLLGLLLEVAALSALAFAFADPVEGSEPPAPRPLAIVLDGSASTMAAGRFEEMKVIARRAADAAGTDTPVTLLLAAGEARVIVSPGETRDRFDAALGGLRPFVIGGGALASAAAAAAPSGAEVLVLTDGCDPDAPALAARKDLRLVSVGRPEVNRGIVGITVERARGREDEVFTRLREADGSMSEGRAGVGPDGVDIRRGSESPFDGFGADDTIHWHPRRPESPLRVAVIAASGQVDPWLAAALESSRPLVDPLSVVIPEPVALQNLPRPPEVVVSIPGAGDPGDFPALVLGAGTGEVIQAPVVQAGDTLHPVMRGVDPAELIVTRSRALDALAGDSILLQGPTGPLVVAGIRAGHRRILLGFDPRESTLPLSAAWPVLVRNSLLWLVEESALSVPVVAAAGSTLDIPVPEGVTSCEVMPHSVTELITGGAVPAHYYDFPDPLGPFRLPVVGGRVRIGVPAPRCVGGRLLVSFAGYPPVDVAIALLDAAESDLTPKVPRNADAFLPTVRPPRGPGPRSRAGDFALGGMAILLLEWVVFLALRAGEGAARPRRDSFPAPAALS